MLNRLQAIATPLVPNMEKVQIIPPPKDVDPRVLVWKGAAVLGKMESVADLWVTPEDWVRALLDSTEPNLTGRCRTSSASVDSKNVVSTYDLEIVVCSPLSVILCSARRSFVRRDGPCNDNYHNGVADVSRDERKKKKEKRSKSTAEQRYVEIQ